MNDRNWWTRKLTFHEELEYSEEVDEIIYNLNIRINSYNLLLEGEISEEFRNLGVIYDLEV